MHQIRFRLGLCPRPRWGAYSAPQTLAGFKGPTSKGRGNAEEWKGGYGRDVGRGGRLVLRDIFRPWLIGLSKQLLVWLLK